MAGWEDEFRDKFKQDLENVRLNKEWLLKKQGMVEGSQKRLWDALVQDTEAAVAKINGSDNFLLFVPNDITNKQIGFRVVFNRDTTQRTAFFEFNPAQHAVKISVKNPDRNSFSKSLSVGVGDDGKVQFVESTTPNSNEQIIQEVMSKLL
jgi:hypothetical protein